MSQLGIEFPTSVSVDGGMPPGEGGQDAGVQVKAQAMDDRPDLVLASASPRRRELLQRLGLRLGVIETHIDESPRAGEPAADYVRRMAAEKVAAAEARPGAPDSASGIALLAADTIVVIEGAILGKPRDEDDARAMLQRLAGRRHEVTTAYRIRCGTRELDRAVTTVVAFRLIDPGEIDAYLGSGEWNGKAGAYAVQGIAAVFVTELRGSLTNVIGLPLAEALADLRALGALPAYPPKIFPTPA